MDAQQTKIYTAIIIAAFVVGGILIFFVISLIQQQRRNSRLFKEKIKAEITTLENERSRVAADLHDELGPLLFSVKFKLSGLETSEEDHDAVEKATAYIDDIIQRIRDISNDLMPGTLIRKGVLYAIEEYIDGLSKNETLKINFVHTGIPELDKDRAINIYRLILEIIHNTLKHAKASLLNIEFKYDQSMLILMSQDNGQGYDYSGIKLNNAGLGLRSMLNRVEVMEGELFVESNPGKGTKYIIEIPLNSNFI
jgi:two-component system, NarL family, sensor kinase